MAPRMDFSNCIKWASAMNNLLCKQVMLGERFIININLRTENYIWRFRVFITKLICKSSSIKLFYLFYQRFCVGNHASPAQQAQNNFITRSLFYILIKMMSHLNYKQDKIQERIPQAIGSSKWTGAWRTTTTGKWYCLHLCAK